MSGWQLTIGLETHAQLRTESKLFSGAATAFGAPPNSQACAVDVALPGVLPVLNRQAVELAIRFGLAVQGAVAPVSVFARKNYFYPDLPKGYQISQYEAPIVAGGELVIQTGGAAKTVRLTRAHLEEDAGKSLHEDLLAHPGLSGIDLNRAGTPLLEIVTEPCLDSAAEAVAYARALHELLVWLEICDGNLQEGSFRCDANVSVRRAGEAALGTRCEIKNLNSFRFLERAIVHEAQRQIELIEDGGKVRQETRLYDPDRDETRSMRGKEDAMDYRYFPDPDLLPLTVGADWIERVRAELPELPGALRERLLRVYGLSVAEVAQVAATRAHARYFEAVVAALPQSESSARLAATWMAGEVAAQLNRTGAAIEACPVTPATLAALLARIADGTLSGKGAKQVFEALWAGEVNVDAAILRLGLRQVSDVAALEAIAASVIAANPKSVAEYQAGKDKAFNALVGQVMKASQGKANPALAAELLKRQLAKG